MNYYGGDKAREYVFQNDMIHQMVYSGWSLGTPDKYNRKLALYSEDLLTFVKYTQFGQLQKLCMIYPKDSYINFIER